jgi:pre-mRNA-splicing factor ATP-dependent RNA helicase DHX15/PRP43
MSSFGIVIIDEAHEHSLPADLLLGHLKGLLRERDDLRVILMSATMNTALLNFFPQAVLEQVPGRQHRVTAKYLEEPSSDLIATIIDTIIHVHCTQMPGDILVFVSGKKEINKVINGVEETLSEERFENENIGPLDFYPLHSSLSVRDQNLALDSPPPRPQYGEMGRKVIVSTNSAETSITIEGVTHVIDSCKAKTTVWNPRTETWTLLDQPISKANILHRKGRAGRTCEGMA